MSGNQPTSSGRRQLIWHPEWLQELRKEIQENHPELVIKYDLWDKDVPDCLSVLGVETNIAIDGMFDDEGLEGIGRLILERLRAKRKSLILPPGIKLELPK